MKSFTAKEFSRCPAKVYEAARKDGEVEIVHDRFCVPFRMFYDENMYEYESIENKKAPD